MAAQFQFVMRSGPTTGKIYPLEAPEIIIGRDASNGVAINDAEISRKHAKLSLHGSAYVIQDLGSTNGSFVNGQRITGTQVLNPGDTVSFGENIVLMYETAQDPNATVISSAQAPKTVAPVRRPAPAPAPAPVQAYSGQVPAGPVAAASAPTKKGGGKVAIIIIVLIVLCLILACIATFVWVDADKSGARWCMFPFSIIGQMLGAVCP
ncbi:MAG: FHA domain-containing protein [Chloroflexi bacterium]|nr:FHA domain-containing protein [Chloroflexota bacterium]